MSDEKKPIIIKDAENGVTYTLEFNRRSVEKAERSGFTIDNIKDYPVTKVLELFHHAFYMHHSGITKDKTDDLFMAIGGLSNDGLLDRLVQLYAVPVVSLANGEGKKANVSVEF